MKKHQTISLQKLMDKYEGDKNAVMDDLDYLTADDHEEESLSPEEIQSYAVIAKELDAAAKALSAALSKALAQDIDQNALANVAVETGISPVSITGLRHVLKDLENYGFSDESDWEEVESA